MLFGISIDSAEHGTEFLVLSAESLQDAESVAKELDTSGLAEVVPLEPLVLDQYRGLARLGTL